jgi:hypothetical protein
VLLAAIQASGCDVLDTQTARLATDCVRASGDPRVIHSASLLTDADVTVDGDGVEVRTRTPIGIGMDLRVKFREWTYRCRRTGERLEFVDYSRGEVVR